GWWGAGRGVGRERAPDRQGRLLPRFLPGVSADPVQLRVHHDAPGGPGLTGPARARSPRTAPAGAAGPGARAVAGQAATDPRVPGRRLRPVRQPPLPPPPPPPAPPPHPP